MLPIIAGTTWIPTRTPSVGPPGGAPSFVCTIESAACAARRGESSRGSMPNAATIRVWPSSSMRPSSVRTFSTRAVRARPVSGWTSSADGPVRSARSSTTWRRSQRMPSAGSGAPAPEGTSTAASSSPVAEAAGGGSRSAGASSGAGSSKRVDPPEGRVTAGAAGADAPRPACSPCFSIR